MAKRLKDDHTGWMQDIVMSYPDVLRWSDAARCDLSRLDREQIPWWVDHLRRAEASARLLRGQLEALAEGLDRRCPVCDVAVTGRADQVYCGARCRQSARRAVSRG